MLAFGAAKDKRAMLDAVAGPLDPNFYSKYVCS